MLKENFPFKHIEDAHIEIFVNFMAILVLFSWLVQYFHYSCENFMVVCQSKIGIEVTITFKMREKNWPQNKKELLFSDHFSSTVKVTLMKYLM